jgi:predicted PurR-regulated permease PerM
LEGKKKKFNPRDAEFARRVFIVVGIVGLALLAWELRSVLILLFGAVVIGTMFRAISSPLQHGLRLPETVAVGLAIVIVAALIGGIGWLFGSQISSQWQTFAEMLPQAWNSVVDRLGAWGMPEDLLSWGTLSTEGGGLLANAAGFLMSIGGGIGTILLLLFGGIFLALQPRFYRTGAIKLVPPRRRAVIADAMDKSETALRLWLRAQLVSMVVIGTLTGFGLWLVGVPSAIVLGLLSGILEFIPFAGPILAAIPGIVLGMSHSVEMGLWALAVYVVVQQAEAYLIYPIVQQWAVHIPAAVLLFALLAFGMLFGPVGVVFAAPLTVVTYVLVKRLYVVEALETATPIPGEDEE